MAVNKTIDELIDYFMEEDYVIGSKTDSEKYLEALQKYGMNGDNVAQFVLCLMYAEGLFVESDFSYAERWMLKLLKDVEKNRFRTESRNPELPKSTDFSGKVYMLAGEIYTELDEDQKAIRYYKKAADFHEPLGNMALSYRYYFGKGVEVNYNTALNYIEKYFKQMKNNEQETDSRAYYIAGLIYGEQLDNVEKALQFFKKGAEAGNLMSQYEAGLYSTYLHDEKSAYQYLMQAADNGFEDAQIEAGRRFRWGIAGFEKSIDQAIKYLSLAIESGTDDAAPYVCLCYIYDDYGKPYTDYNLAIEYGEYAINNCEFYDEDDLDVYHELAWSYYQLGQHKKALAYLERYKEYGVPEENYSELYDMIVKDYRSTRVFGFIDQIFNNEIIDQIPYVNIMSRTYKAGSRIMEALFNRDFGSAMENAQEIKDLYDSV